nr:glycoside hydrolase family 3 N-terminal domain-containing protein [Candidatus Sigynarchaeota archaeon]
MSDSNGTNQPGSSPFRDERLDVDARAADLLKQMTIDEKLAICNGKTLFLMKPIKRLGIPSVGITDGPCGVGSHSNWLKRNTLFGCGILFGSTWNLDLLAEFGTAVAQEVRACGKHVLLGPGVNIQRSPLCGRTWEYLSEDPFLAKKLAPAIIKGIQSQRIGACVKHFACNSSETRRNRVSAEVSERALQEIYLPAFKASVMDGDTWSLMSSYNRINGIYASENKDLLISKLRDQWGSKGFVMSDWYATLPTTSTEACVNAGLSLDMPGRSSKAKLHIKRMREAFKAGKFTEEMLNENVRRMLRVMILVGLLDDPASIPKGSRNTPEHRAISRKVAADGMVLLKNEKNVLPLDASKIKTIAVLGPNANMKSMAIPMSGVSAWVSPPHEITPLRGLKKACKGKIKIVKDPAKADVAIVVAGLNHRIGQDSESGDRKRLELPSK